MMEAMAAITLVVGFYAVLTVTPVLTLTHFVMAIRRRNTALSRFLLLGLGPSIYFAFVLAIPSHAGGWWFPFLRRYWPPQFDVHWVTSAIGEFGAVLPAFVGLFIFALEVRRGHLGWPLIRPVVALAYLGALCWLYLIAGAETG